MLGFVYISLYLDQKCCKKIPKIDEEESDEICLPPQYLTVNAVHQFVPSSEHVLFFMLGDNFIHLLDFFILLSLCQCCKPKLHTFSMVMVVQYANGDGAISIQK